jgi:hypothetical protein
VLAPAPTRFDAYAELADVVEGRVALQDVPYRLWATLSDADQAAAAKARRDVERADALLASFRDLHGVDLADRSTLLDQAERMAAAEAEFVYWPGDSDPSASSLDTGQQFDIGTLAPRRERSTNPPGASDRGADRVRRYDQAKVGLGAAIREAAGERWETDPAGAILLDAMAGRLDGCRKVKAYRDACGAWFARPESCHVRTCPDCERSRSARLVRRLDQVAGAMARPAFWTFTIPNVPTGQLGDGIDVLLDAFAALRRLALFRGGQCRSAHGDPLDDQAPRRPCRHRTHRASLGASCTCARCTPSDGRGVPGLDVGPCRHRGPRGGRCGRAADDHDGAGHPYRAGRRVRGCRRCRHDPVRGGVYAVEVTYSGDRGDWHPPLHALVDAPYILQAEMRDAWRAVTCDATRRRERAGRRSRRTTGTRRELVESPPPAAGEGAPQRPASPLPRCPHRADADGRSIDGCRGASMVWVEAVKGAPGSPERRAAIRETVKYVTKGILGAGGELNASLRGRDLGDLLLALRGRRLVAGWGTLRHVTDDPEDADDGAAGERLGADAPPELRGLPVTCPSCKLPADWQLPILVDRRDCRPLAGGALVWHPPPPAGHGP